jgi:glycolate oxidase FAD binding subunit
VGLSELVAAVGTTGPVVAVGGRTQWDVGGAVASTAREVHAPTGVVAFEPAEMTVRVGAGTTVADLDAVLAEAGQTVAMPSWPGATIGGVLAVGHSGIRRLGWGPVRDVLLEARYVSADGRLVVAGGPTVKNVSGYDLCRLLVGSLGTLGIIGEVVLRTRPVPAAEQWLTTDTDPFALRRKLHRPACVLWDGDRSWVLLDGHPEDIETEAAAYDLVAATGPPASPPHRWSLRPSALRHLEGRGWLAEVGVGVVHHPDPQPPTPFAPEVVALHRRIKTTFDPTGRLAPGRVLAA